MGDVLLIPESNVRLEPMDDVRGRETEVRGSGEGGRASLLPTYTGSADGGSGRRLGVRIRTLREGLGAAVCLDVLPDGVGEGARLRVVRVGEVGMGGGDDGVVCLGGGEIGSVDLPASNSFSNSGRTLLSLARPNSGAAAPAGVASCTREGGADETKFGDSCRISSIDPMSPLLLGATGLSIGSFSPSVCNAGAEGAALSLSLSLLLSLEARCCCGVGERIRNVTLRLSRLSVNMGRYCDCGLNPDVAFRLVFSRMVSMSCTSLRRCRSVRLITRPQCFHMITSKTASATPPTTPPTIGAIGTDVPPPLERAGKPDCADVPLE